MPVTAWGRDAPAVSTRGRSSRQPTQNSHQTANTGCNQKGRACKRACSHAQRSGTLTASISTGRTAAKLAPRKHHHQQHRAHNDRQNRLCWERLPGMHSSHPK